MTILRLVVDQMVGPVPGGIGRYTEELARELIAGAPVDCAVSGIVSASPETDYAHILEQLPGLISLDKSALARRELAIAWEYGLTGHASRGIVHAPSLLAPLRSHDRLNGGHQVAVTIHDVVPWTHPHTLTRHGVAWHKAMAARAHRYADAVVVDTHAVAAQLAEILDFGDRIRVIGAAVSSKLALPVDAAERADRLNLPEEFILSVGTLEPRKGIVPLISSLAHAESADLPLLIVGPAGWGDLNIAQIASDAGLETGRVRSLGYLENADLAVALDRATVFAFPSLAEGFGLPLLEAFSLGTPVVHSDDPALVEVAAGAGVAVALAPAQSYPERLAHAIRSVVDDAALAERLGVLGADRARTYTWRDTAEKVWQLHADL
jgi:glycosyltransferase involved in cell wall biosynthesis